MTHLIDETTIDEAALASLLDVNREFGTPLTEEQTRNLVASYEAAKQLPKSGFKLGDTPLHKLTHAELLEAVNSVWEQKNKEIRTVEVERDALRKLLASPLPIHNLWRAFADNAALMAWVAFMAYLIGAHHV